MRCKFTVFLSAMALAASAAPALAARVVVAVRPPVARVVVPVRPPVTRVAVVPTSVVAGYVWRPGYWSWTGTRYVWVAGVYVASPYPGASWVPGRWVPGTSGWVWLDGHWR
jgi:type IV secretory pathway VirB2 component (pilin)